MIKKSPYEILGLDGDFEFKDIKKAYRKAVRENPPEMKPEAFAEISDAYDMLTNEDYFAKDTENAMYALSVDMEVNDEKNIAMSKYLKNSFEVPFLI